MSHIKISVNWWSVWKLPWPTKINLLYNFTKVNCGLEGTSDIMVAPKFGVGSIPDCGRPAPRTGEIRIINWTDKMDPTPNFGVTMISEVPSNPQLTLERIRLLIFKIFLHQICKIWIGIYEVNFIIKTLICIKISLSITILTKHATDSISSYLISPRFLWRTEEKSEVIKNDGAVPFQWEYE